MLIFHEGLPGHGKSYAAIKDYLIPQLAAGRHVYARINGLDFDRIAEVLEKDRAYVENLLHPVAEEDVLRIYEIAQNDSFVIWDELQNFLPYQRGKKALADPRLQQWIAEHRHHGIDVLFMGQVMTDCHTFITNRVDQLVVFQKRDVFGKANEYTCIVKKPIRKGDKVAFETVSTSKAEYDPKYFGLYASHKPDTLNKETLTDDRANIWKRPIFRKWLPLYGLLLVAAVAYLWHFFHGGVANSVAPAQAAQTPAKGLQPGQTTPPPPSTGKTSGGPSKVGMTDGIIPDSPADLIQDLTQKNRIRLIGTWRLRGLAQNGVIEWRDLGGNLVQAMSFRDIEGLGYTIFVNTGNSIAVIQRGDVRYVATNWQIDKREAVATESQQERIRGRPYAGGNFSRSENSQPSDTGPPGPVASASGVAQSPSAVLFAPQPLPDPPHTHAFASVE
ncbi:MAG: hypothetical protein JSR19_01415 [Proteobacteria bacterium]|nr:hypothetical protein [Pseudomonadota bacterium]HQR02508.1 zonular occludens toxin domain-containing protein [Rhodocyclaceae bacterium]